MSAAQSRGKPSVPTPPPAIQASLKGHRTWAPDRRTLGVLPPGKDAVCFLVQHRLDEGDVSVQLPPAKNTQASAVKGARGTATKGEGGAVYWLSTIQLSSSPAWLQFNARARTPPVLPVRAPPEPGPSPYEAGATASIQLGGPVGFEARRVRIAVHDENGELVAWTELLLIPSPQHHVAMAILLVGFLVPVLRLWSLPDLDDYGILNKVLGLIPGGVGAAVLAIVRNLLPGAGMPLLGLPYLFKRALTACLALSLLGIAVPKFGLRIFENSTSGVVNAPHEMKGKTCRTVPYWTRPSMTAWEDDTSGRQDTLAEQSECSSSELGILSPPRVRFGCRFYGLEGLIGRRKDFFGEGCKPEFPYTVAIEQDKLKDAKLRFRNDVPLIDLTGLPEVSFFAPSGEATSVNITVIGDPWSPLEETSGILGPLASWKAGPLLAGWRAGGTISIGKGSLTCLGGTDTKLDAIALPVEGLNVASFTSSTSGWIGPDEDSVPPWVCHAGSNPPPNGADIILRKPPSPGEALFVPSPFASGPIRIAIGDVSSGTLRCKPQGRGLWIVAVSSANSTESLCAQHEYGNWTPEPKRVLWMCLPDRDVDLVQCGAPPSVTVRLQGNGTLTPIPERPAYCCFDWNFQPQPDGVNCSGKDYYSSGGSSGLKCNKPNGVIRIQNSPSR